MAHDALLLGEGRLALPLHEGWWWCFFLTPKLEIRSAKTWDTPDAAGTKIMLR
jgi:hypothetical protein